MDYLVTKIRGEEGTDVTLEIYRPSERKYHTVTITRRKLENSTVSYFMADADKKIGYVRVTQFVANKMCIRDRNCVAYKFFSAFSIAANGQFGVVAVDTNPSGASAI